MNFGQIAHSAASITPSQLLKVPLNYTFKKNAAAVHFIFQIDHWRATIMPSQSAMDYTTRDNHVGKHRMKIVNCVDLRGGGVFPIKS